jgi:thiamine-phosphate pyrophosphorylase
MRKILSPGLRPASALGRGPRAVGPLSGGAGVLRAGEGSVWRLLDANVNRAREGLRIVEDTARFVLDDAAAARALRGLRHELDVLVRRHYKTLLSHRQVETDSGRRNLAKPYVRIDALLAANFKRCEEALRVIEEYGRLLSPKAAGSAQALRFEVYKWEKKLC